jgi:hypothetical protein
VARKARIAEALKAVLRKKYATESERSAVVEEIMKRADKKQKKGERLNWSREVSDVMTSMRKEQTEVRDARVSQRTADYESGEEVAAAITEKVDLVELGAELLSGKGDIKNASTKLRMWEAIMERMFGKIAPAPHEDETAPPQVVLEGLPRPERKKTKEKNHVN